MNFVMDLVPRDGVRVACVAPCTEAEGPGRRFAIWFQGCPLRCPGCCNPEMLAFAGGELRSVSDLICHIERAQAEHALEGLTLLGGEPFAHATAAANIAAAAQHIGLSVMVFSGYTLAELLALGDSNVERLLAHTDILVDGRYESELPDRQRRWIGSTNQTIHFLTSRYSAHDACWRQANTLEIRLVGNELMVNGFPSSAAASVWKRLAHGSTPRGPD